MTIRKEIVYPIFLDCYQYASDTYWEHIFEDLAYGKPPYGTYISKDYLCCSYKKKEFSYKIEKKEAKIMYEEIYEILTRKLGLLSNSEKAKKKKDFSDFEENMRNSRKNWCDINKKNIKELLIELFVSRMKNRHQLTISQAKNLLSAILIAMVFKVITSNDIVYENNQITSIKGIEFAKKQVFFNRELYNIESSSTPHIIIEKKLMSDNWEKYQKTLKKLEV